MGHASAWQKQLTAVLVASLALATSNVGWAKKKTVPQGPVPCAASFDDAWASLAKRDATAREGSSVTLARRVIPKAEDADLLGLAKGACDEVAYVDKTFSMPAYMCMGEASARLAALEVAPSQNHADAYCAFELAVELSAKAGANKPSLARAHEGRARSLMALRALGTPGSDSYGNLAVSAYEEAIRLEDSAPRRFALGRVLLDLGNLGGAEREIRAGAEQQPKGAQTALALVSLAEAKRAQGAPADEVLGILKLAKQAAPTSASANGAIGIAYFQLGKSADAKKAFEAVIDPAATNGGSDYNYRADAHYYLAVLEAREATKTADWDSVLGHAERAVQAGGSDFRFRRLVCLSRIARGGEGVSSGATAAWCEGQDTPEGELLRGVYYLRMAQYVPRFRLRNPPSQNELKWRELLRKAEDAFEEGGEALASQTKPATSFDWPGLAVNPDLAASLAYGKQLVRHANTFCRDNSLLPDDQPQAKALFERFRVLRCTP